MPYCAGRVFPWIERVKRRSCARPGRGTSPAAPLSGAFLSSRLLGQRLGQAKKHPNAASLFENINTKKFLISYEIRNFLVETAGLEPVTSCV